MKILQVLLFFLCVCVVQAEDYFIVCSGQSNMGGVAKIEDLPKELGPVPENVLYFRAFDATKPPEPVKSFAEGTKFGPMPSFLHALSLAYPKDRFIVLHDAVGGSALASWVPDYGPEELKTRPGKNGTTVKLDVGKNYRGMTKRIGALRKAYPEAKSLALVWIQGESDAGKWADAYLENFQRLVANVKKDMGATRLYIIVGEPGKTVDAVREAFRSYVKSDPQSAIAPGVDLSHGEVHYDAKGYLELGKRLAKELETLLSKSPAAS